MDFVLFFFWLTIVLIFGGCSAALLDKEHYFTGSICWTIAAFLGLGLCVCV